MPYQIIKYENFKAETQTDLYSEPWSHESQFNRNSVGFTLVVSLSPLYVHIIVDNSTD